MSDSKLELRVDGNLNSARVKAAAESLVALYGQVQFHRTQEMTIKELIARCKKEQLDILGAFYHGLGRNQTVCIRVKGGWLLIKTCHYPSDTNAEFYAELQIVEQSELGECFASEPAPDVEAFSADSVKQL